MGSFLLSAAPFTGHVVPLCAVAAALVRRGHHVRIYTGEAFRDQVTASGAELVPWQNAPSFDESNLAATFPRLVGKKGVHQLLVNVQDVFLATATAQVADLSAEWERHRWDVIVADEVSVGAALHAEITGCAWATVAVLPLTLPGPHGPPSGMGLAPGQNPLTRLRDAALRALVPVLSGSLTGPLSRARAEVGLPASTLTFDRALFSPRMVVASGLAALDYGRKDRPRSVHFVGALTAATVATAAAPLPEWWGDLDANVVIYVTQGTLNTDPDDVLRPAAAALAGVDAIVVMTTGIAGRDEVPFEVPPNVRIAGRLPYDQLLPRVDIMVTNGGWGGTMQALAHGIPLVIAGGDLDKPEVAARVAWARAGINLKTGRPSPAALGRAVERLQTDPEFRAGAEVLANELGTAGGAAHAAELVETLLA